ncbi:hypothetical protein A2210_02385 [Candidatus Woesebacteria bacterium RIFOXYA1_FULL_40_18]|uniref:Glycosyltransferase 2-like domain-containing protein n=3 Tax=Candidatus Woeseibacteriota TaxID=1752722 RepID=A0A1F8CNK9_9BACT|nr:MAG: hypothetical protein A2210_02385 [Candidatus Woesebacteria bacterium RIFOXYA1_FULL_40_18]OGM79926.1 MAG: hypothetical protein A2361_01660 [Candidatus Woesebacteria bacterium RIFOXYB1_FULL_40_26]OGM88380.1 MAG: hypothetical protein A2614_02105 [Candidatus Woesebacteria bacterium RIFOXYD1_FULL_40_21]
MGKISAVLNVIDEEIELLPRALASIENLADEIVIVDMTTSPKEVKTIGVRFNARICPHERVNYVELIRNFGIIKATNEWVLILDPDEEIPPTLAKKLKELVKKNEYAYFRIPRKNIVFGKWLRHSRWWPDYNIRFFKKGSVSWSEIIHAVPITSGRGADLPEKEEYAITHHNYQTIEQFLDRMNRYTTVASNMKIKEGYRFIWRDMVQKPSSEFLSRYFAGEGYKDGLHGLTLALLQAFSEIILYIKIWQKEKFLEQAISAKEIENEFGSLMNDVRFWLADMSIKTKDIISSLPDRIIRKLSEKNA